MGPSSGSSNVVGSTGDFRGTATFKSRRPSARIRRAQVRRQPAPHGHRVTGGDGVLQGLHAQRMRIMIDEGNEYGGLEVGQGRLDAEPQALGEPTKDGKHPEVETTATLLLLLISFAVAALVLPMFLLFDSLYRHIKRINFFT
uniref:Uncharacterized protein n=2 Tax=Phytophthora fragariae TaxID=53985 RepID=A0A6A3DSQ2_9STRA|nr:hypothetical protein PF009_g27533 [Phytophthora fragariae]